ncbi:MAG: chaperone modulator CbpM [Gammaproteobacteria bacterium]|nr:chaperone modulator CbpM [Gammaproteobacteria bacterium]
MTIHINETIWLNETATCSIEHLSEISGLSVSELVELVETGVLLPSNNDPEHYEFQLSYVVIARTARRLRDDFELDTRGLAVALHLLKRINALERELGHN